MSVLTIPVICYYNGNILRIETYVKYGGRKAVIVPLDVPVECTFEQLTDMSYLEWVSKLMVPGSSPRRRKKPL